MKLIQKIFLYSFLFLLGVAFFWWLYRDLDWTKLKQGLLITNYYWIIVSILLGLLSHYVRAIRWKMLIRPMGYNPKVNNIFLSVLVMYFTNLIIPRAGEVARCTILSRYEKIPASKLIGTMIVERIADMVTMFILIIIVFIINVGVVKEFFIQNPGISANFIKLLSFRNIIVGIIAFILIIVLLFVIKPFKNTKIGDKIKKLEHGFKEGIKTILVLNNRLYFIGCTLFIFSCWLFMLFAVFKAYPPTSHLSIEAGMFTFLMGGLAMLAPVQAGIGAWHYMVIKSVLLYGIPEENGKIFALVAHSSTSLIYLFFGFIALALFPIMNKNYKGSANGD